MRRGDERTRETPASPGEARRTPLPQRGPTARRRLVAWYVDLRTQYPLVGLCVTIGLASLGATFLHLALGGEQFFAFAAAFLALLAVVSALAPAGPLVRAFQHDGQVRVVLEPQNSGKPFTFESLHAEIGSTVLPLGDDGLPYQVLRPGGGRLLRGETVAHQTVLLLDSEKLLNKAAQEGASTPTQAWVAFVVTDCALNAHRYEIRVHRKGT